MSRRRVNVTLRAFTSVFAAMALVGCSEGSPGISADADTVAEYAAHCPQADDQSEPPPAMGLMTGLPLTYPLGADFAAFARGEVERTWQGKALSQCYTSVPLDTLASTGGLDPALGPLSGLEYLAVIQPRGLSPQDNVALDDWVRAGGRLLLVLDPMLTGEYDLPLGDPRRPGAVAFIPPVVGRWGMTVTFDEGQAFEPRRANAGGFELPVLLAGEIAMTGGDCSGEDVSSIQKCQIGEGTVTLLADAAIFEDQELAGAQGKAILAVLAFAFER